ncbi:MAG TPA: type II toxin-antitoxin system Phd/YefM family antitoxin [Actinobacteria bacterium]|nr:type II toxin-antitoxin system Phd/YefM family antitoxin [Actinomycetes bacterium]HEX21699.1 type II toxin-antitoxin system Phd/YefM family antitoxin [Actinomycetota bacterium]
MATINVHEAKTNFSKLLSRVESGEEIVIAKAGKPVAKMMPLANKVDFRKSGSAKGRVVIKKDFFAPLPDEILKEFEE